MLVPAYWDLVEPVEGKFDFSLVDKLLEGARKNKLRVVFLWFASWKNSMSCYAPAWVKTNQDRFPRSQNKEGRGMEILSPFAEENVAADAKAFAAFMRHLREVDGDQHTVLMVQVENEIGMIPEARDWSQLATKLYQQRVPQELMDRLLERKESLMPEFRKVWEVAGSKTAGTWEEVFGKGLGTEEIFMAWYFARFTNRVTQAGKAEYRLPMFANAALIRPNYPPGRYPSAGPLPHLLDVCAPERRRSTCCAPTFIFRISSSGAKNIIARATRCLFPRRCADRAARRTFFTPSASTMPSGCVRLRLIM